MASQAQWDEEAEVVVVGYGGAGVVTAITAHDAGAKVLILEKQRSDTPTRTNHSPSTRSSGGHWWSPVDLGKTILYMEGMVRISNEPLDAERKEIIRVFAQHLMENTDWMKKVGIGLTVDLGTGASRDARFGVHFNEEGKVFMADFYELPGSECSAYDSAKPEGRYHGGGQLCGSLLRRQLPIGKSLSCGRLRVCT